MPFIPLYYSYLGVDDNQIGLLGSITPTLTAVVSPLWGALADATGRDKEIMLFTFALSTVVRFGLVYASKVPKHRLASSISLLVGLSAIINAPVKPLLDACVMQRLKDKSQFGRSRLYGQLGFGFGSWLVGPFLGKREIRSIFVVQALLALPTTVFMLLFLRARREPVRAGVGAGKEQQQKKRPPSTSSSSPSPSPSSPLSSSDFVTALRHVGASRRILAFFSYVFLLGISSGIVENFAYVHLKDAGGYDGSVLGVCRLVSSVAGVPMFWMAGGILRAVGVNGILLTSMAAYVARFTLYANIRNTWQALPAEVLRGATFALFTTASTFYVYQESPPALVATMLSLLSGTYNGLGQSVGSLVGGALSKRVGIIRTFNLCAVLDTVLALGFAGYLVFFKQQQLKEQKQQKRR